MKICVIGGGIIGLCAAYYLSEAGHAVIITEKDKIAEKASSGNAGALWPSVPSRNNNIIGELGLESLKLFDTLSKEFDFDYERCGAIEAFFTERGMEEARRDTKAARKGGYRIKLLTKQEIHEMEPELSERVRGGVYCPRDAKGDSYELALELAKKIKKNGGKILENCEAKGFSFLSNTVDFLKTTKGKVKADYYINCLGPWSPFLKGSLKIPVKPVKGYSIMIKTTKSERSIRVDGTAIVNHRNLVKVGGIVENKGYDLSVEKRGIEKLASIYKKTFPKRKFKIVEKNSCLRPMTPDKIPIIGKDSKYRNLIIATGHYRDGFMLAPITGKLVKIIMDNGKSKFLRRLSPLRF